MKPATPPQGATRFSKIRRCEHVSYCVARRLRFIPNGGALVEVTCRTIQGRFLLRPSEELRSLIVGVLARAQKLYPVEIHAFVFLSNHYHLLVSVEDAQRLARFMNFVNSNLAREAGRLYQWKEKFWGRRYQAIVVSEEELAQANRLRYLLQQGCKEGLVARPRDWPGAQCVSALVAGRPIRGRWVSRSQEYAARSRGETFRHRKYSTAEMIRLEPLPCWRHVSGSIYRSRVSSLIKEIEEETAARHEREGTRPLGVGAILAQHPHDRPEEPKRGLPPAFHVATKAARQGLAEAYRWFAVAYREASRKLREGSLAAKFPQGSFPPALPFVGRYEEIAPG